MIEYRYLPAFFAVAELRSFTKAGVRLHIATSAVSRQIQLLEESCGAQLFFRSPREAKMTEVGERLFDELGHFQKRAESVFGERSVGTLRLGSLQGVLQHWLVDFISSYDAFKQLNFEIEVANPEELIQDVASGKLDVAFFSMMAVPHVPTSLRVIRLFCEEIVLVSKDRITLEQIDDFPWIVFSTSAWMHHHSKRDPERFVIVNDMNAIVELARRGMGIAMVPMHMIADRRGLHILPIKKFSREFIYAAVRRYEREPPLIKQFVGLLKTHATK